MLDFNNFNNINENNIENRYPYKRIIVSINSYDDMVRVCETIDNLFNITVNTPSLVGQEFPNFACIVVESIYSSLENSYNRVRVRYFNDDPCDVDDIIKFMEDDEEYANIEDILDMNQLDKISNMIYKGKKTQTISDIYKPKINVYESKNDINYPYHYVMIEVNSKDDIKKIYDYIDKTYNKESYRAMLREDVEFKNYIFINVNGLKDSSTNNYELLVYTYGNSNNNILNLIKEWSKNNPNEVNIDDILTMDNLNNFHYLINFYHSREVFKNYSKNVSDRLVYENNNIYPYEDIVFEVNNIEDVKKILEYLEGFYNVKLEVRGINSSTVFPNYYFVPVNFTSLYEFNKNCLVLSHSDASEDALIRYYNNYHSFKLENILRPDEIYSYGNLIKTGNKSNFDSIYIKPKKKIYESSEYYYPYDRILIWLSGYEDYKTVIDYINTMFNKEYTYISNNRPFNHVLLKVEELYDLLEDNTIELRRQDLIKFYDENIYDTPEELKRASFDNFDDNYFNLDDVLKIDELRYIKSLLNSGKKTDFKSMYVDPKKKIYESNTSTVLNAFDLDETLVFNKTFEENIKHLLLEYKTPTEIFFDKINSKNIKISNLKYENGRIYFNDPMNDFKIDKYDTDWVRKKDRVYLTQPEEYLLTDESLPISINEKILELYNESVNRCIVTARLENSRTNLKKRLNELGIKQPNYGLFMLNDKYSNKVKFKVDTLINLQKKYHFEVINYYDDNVKLLKRMKEYLTEKNIHINLFKVTKNEIRRI